jgi:ribokinase
MNPRVMIFGPAYLDRVLRVNGPLGLSDRPPLDQSVDGTGRFGKGPCLSLDDHKGSSIFIKLPTDWPGPAGSVRLACPLLSPETIVRGLLGVDWSDDLGGMGAGFAAALGGTLCHALGPEDDPTSRKILELLARHGIERQTIRVTDRAADWTLLVTSGAHGDKLAIGFRGCHATLEPAQLDPYLASTCSLRVVAGLPNRLAGHAALKPGAGCTLFAPGIRNVVDREYPVSRFASAVDIFCCNRQEWERLDDREEVAWRVSILVVTDGPAGVSARFTTPSGEPGQIHLPAFPRVRPPRDTNRAGEALAATFVAWLMASGWEASSAVIENSLMLQALVRASAAAALVLDREHFGFPGQAEIDETLRTGHVE